jgi:hypothetical protein
LSTELSEANCKDSKFTSAVGLGERFKTKWGVKDSAEIPSPTKEVNSTDENHKGSDSPSATLRKDSGKDSPKDSPRDKKEKKEKKDKKDKKRGSEVEN